MPTNKESPREIEQRVPDFKRKIENTEATVAGANISSNIEKISEQFTKKKKDNIFNKLTESIHSITDVVKFASLKKSSKSGESIQTDKIVDAIRQSSIVNTAVQGAVAGQGKKLGALTSLLKTDFSALVSGKFQNLLADETKSKDKEEKGGEKPHAPKKSSGKGNEEIDNLVNTVVNIVSKFDEIKGKAKDANKTLNDISGTNFTAGILKFLNQFTDPNLEAFLVNPEYSKFESKRQDLFNKINSEADPIKRAKYLKMAESVVNPNSKEENSPSVKAKEIISGLTDIFDTVGGMDKISISSVSKFKSIGKLNIGSTIKEFLNQFNDPAFSAFTTDKVSLEHSRLYNAMENKELFIARKNLSGESLAQAEIDIVGKYSSKKEDAAKSPSGAALQAVEGVINILGTLSELKNIGISSILRLKVVNKLGLGKEIGKLIKNISINLKEVNTPDFKESLDSLSSTVGSIDTFSAGFHRTIFKVMKLSILKPGFWIRTLFSSLMFDLPGSVEKQYQKMDEFGIAKSIQAQIDSETDPTKKAELQKELHSTATKSPGTMFSRLVSEKLAGLETVMGTMGGIREVSSKAMKSVMMSIPMVKIATKGMGMIVDMVFSLIKRIDKLMEKAIPKQGLISKLFGPKFLKDQQESKKQTLAEHSSKISDIVTLINSIGGIDVGQIKSAALGMLIASKLKFGETFPQIASGIIFSLKQFKNVSVKQAEDFKKILTNIFDGISNSMKNLAKLSLMSRLAKRTIDGFASLAEKVQEIIKKFDKEKTEKIDKDHNIFKGIKHIIDSLKGIGRTIVELAAVTVLIPVAMLGLTFIVGTIALLSKIGKDKDTNKGVHVSLGVATGIIGFILKMAFAGLLFTLLAPVIVLGLGLVYGVTKFFQYLAGRKIEHDLSKGVHGLVKLALGIAFFALILTAAAVLMSAVSDKILVSVGILSLTILIFALLGKLEPQIKKGAFGILLISLGVVVFAVAMLLFTKAFSQPGSIMGAIIGLGLLFGTIFIFSLIGDRILKIEKGVVGILLMSLGVAIFAIAMYIMVKAFSNPMAMLGAIAGLILMVGFAFVFTLIGERALDIAKGAAGIIIMSIGIAFFGISIGILSNVINLNKINFESIAMMSLMIAGLAIVFAGVGFVAANVALGSVAVITMAVALGIFSFAFEKVMKSGFDKLDEKGWNGIFNIAKLIGLFGIEFALIGAPWAFPFIVLGSGAVALMGVAISSIVSGLKDAMKIDWSKIPIDSIKATIIGLGEAFGAVGREGSKGLGILGAGLSLLGIGPNNVKRGIEAVLNSAAALREVATGLQAFDSLTKSLDLRVVKNKDGIYEPADGSLLQRIAMSLSVVNKVFSDIGKSGNTNNSLIGLMFGSDFKKSDTEIGIKSVLESGKALMSVGMGLKSFDQLTKDIDLRSEWNNQKQMYEPLKDSVPHKISVVLGVVNKVFSDIGKSGNTNNSLIGMIFGSDMKKSDTEVGIKSVMESGKALMSVATGLKSFDQLTKDINLQTKGEVNGYPIPAIGSVPHKITTVLGIINKVFSDIGASGNTNNSVIGMIFGSDMKKSDVEIGIKSVMSAGDALTGIAKGLLSFDNLTKGLNFDASKDKGIGTTGSSPQSIQGKIGMVLGIINQVFGNIGKSANSGLIGLLGFDVGKSDVEKGIESVKGVGQEFTSIAEGLKLWSDMEKQKINLPKISENIKLVLTMIGGVFAQIGKLNSGEGLLSTGDVTAGVKAVQGIGKEFTSIADGLKGYMELQKQGIKIQDLTRNITQVLTAVSNVFSGIGSGNIVDFDGKTIAKVDSESIQKGVQSIQGVGGELKNISDSLKGFSDLKKSGLDIKTIGDNIKTILLAVSSAFAEIGKSSGSKAIPLGTDKSQRIEYYGTDAVKKGVESVKGLGQELKLIAEGIRPFMDLQKEKISIPKLGSNIKEILLVVSKVFEEIGSKSSETVDSNGVNQFTGTAAIARGVKSVEGVGSVLKGIADMLRPFMDMQKSEKGQKGINIKTIKRNIAEMVSLTADIFGALGGDMGAQGRIKTDTGVSVATLDANLIENVIPVIKKAQEGLSIITAVSDLANKIDPQKWNKIKDIIPAMAMMPVKIFTEITTVYNTMQSTEVSDLIDNIIPKLILRINDIVNSQNNLSNKIKAADAKSSPLSKLGTDMRKFLLDISKPPSDVVLDRVNRTVQFIERYSAVAPQFKIFQESYSKHVKDVQTLVNSVNKVQNAQFDKYIRLQEVVKDMITSSADQVKNNVAAVISLLGQESQFLDRVEVIQKNGENNSLQPDITLSQQQILDRLSNTPIQNLTQIELLQLIAINSGETLDKLKSKIRVYS